MAYILCFLKARFSKNLAFLFPKLIYRRMNIRREMPEVSPICDRTALKAKAEKPHALTLHTTRKRNAPGFNNHLFACLLTPDIWVDMSHAVHRRGLTITDP